MSQYLVIACKPCLLPDAETIRDDMTKWCKPEHIVIFERAEVDALIVGSME